MSAKKKPLVVGIIYYTCIMLMMLIEPFFFLKMHILSSFLRLYTKLLQLCFRCFASLCMTVDNQLIMFLFVVIVVIVVIVTC